MSDSHDYDLVVIGSGPGGEKGAAQAAYFGKRVALVERGGFGGTCVHTGTIPSKSLRESALYLSGIRTRAIEGLLHPNPGKVLVTDLMAHKDRVCEEESNRVYKNLERHHARVFQGTGSLLDPHTVRVHHTDGTRQDLSAQTILIATGSRPFRPESLPFDGRLVCDSDEILQPERVPQSLVVIGGGVIGCEYASIFAALGAQVTLVETHDAVLPFVDREIVTRLMEGFEDLGMTLRLKNQVERVAIRGPSQVEVALSSGRTLTVDTVLFAAGRQGNVEELDLAAQGIQVDKRGHILVNEHYQTGCPSVYAVGDVIGFPALASSSMEQGRVAMCHAFDLKYKTEVARLIPYGIYTIPELSMVGATEDQLLKQGRPFEVGRSSFHDNARGRINGYGPGLLKLVFDPTDKRLLGVHLVGEQAAELVHIGMTAMHHQATIDTFIDAVYNFPTLSEAYKYAAYDGLGRLQKRSL